MLLKDVFMFFFHCGVHRSLLNQSQKAQGWKFTGLFLFRLPVTDLSGEVNVILAYAQKQ